jgi:hypothetical protein
MAAFEIMAPLESCTVPKIVPEVTWARIAGVIQLATVNRMMMQNKSLRPIRRRRFGLLEVPIISTGLADILSPCLSCGSAGNQIRATDADPTPGLCNELGASLLCSRLHAVNPFVSSAKSKPLIVYPVAATRRHIANASCSPIPVPRVFVQRKADVNV